MFTLDTISSIVKDGKFETVYLILSIFGWFTLIVLLLCSYLLSAKRLFKNYSLANSNSVTSFSFGDESFFVSWHSELSDGKTEYNYEILETAEKKGDFFILKATQVGIWSIKTSDIINGTPDELEQLLMKKLGDKFTVR